MKEFLTTIPGIVISLGAILSVVVIGLLFILGLWKKGKNGEDDRLIDILKSTVDALETKVNKQTTDIEALTKEVRDLKRDNEKYIEIFQGRDKETKDFYERAYKAIDTVAQTHDIITTVAESIKNTNSAMEKLIELLSKSVDVVQNIAGK